MGTFDKQLIDENNLKLEMKFVIGHQS